MLLEFNKVVTNQNQPILKAIISKAWQLVIGHPADIWLSGKSTINYDNFITCR